MLAGDEFLEAHVAGNQVKHGHQNHQHRNEVGFFAFQPIHSPLRRKFFLQPKMRVETLAVATAIVENFYAFKIEKFRSNP